MSDFDAPEEDWRQLTPPQVEQKLRQMVHTSERLVLDYCEEVARAARDKVAYEVAKAQAVLKQVGHEGTVSEKEARATVEVKDELFTYRTQEAIADAAKEAHRALLAQMTAVQTIAAQQRAELGHADRLSGWRGQPS